jgi:hypothetical protein
MANNEYGFRCICPRGFAGPDCSVQGMSCFPGQFGGISSILIIIILFLKKKYIFFNKC